MKTCLLSCLIIFLILPAIAFAAYCPANPVIFVTQMPIPQDFATINSTFGNQSGDISERGIGDLYIVYPDCSLKNLTAAAGFGSEGMQTGSNSIAVRDPSVHWSGAKAIFSMVVGAPSQQYEYNDYYWQLYEITGLGKNETPVITKVPNQPSDYNNIMPIYGTDEQIIFVTDRPRNGNRHLYPQRDEYESTATNTGVWKLNPSNGELKILDHAPSGDFNPIIDSYGRVIMTRWDHLQSDQQAGPGKTYGAFNYSSEAENATKIDSYFEFFPENQDPEDQEAIDSTVSNHRFNFFFPWMIHEDGTGMETLNHIGRHELVSYLDKSFKNDINIQEFYGQYYRFNQNPIESFHHIKEDPAHQGTYFGINCPEFGTHAAGQIVSIDGNPAIKASNMSVTYVTHHDTSFADDTPSVNHSGLYRNPLPLNDGTLISVHTTETRADTNIGSTSNPQSRYHFRLKKLTKNGAYYSPSDLVTPGITKNISFYNPDILVTYNGEMWELQPTEVIARSKPAGQSEALPSQELEILSEEGIALDQLKTYLLERDLALIISRNVTKRDSLDLQQPFNLRVTGTNTQTIGASGKIYDVGFFQMFQGDQVRGYGGVDSPQAGRRVLAQPLHDAMIYNPQVPNSPAGSTFVASDGSLAAFVPAGRALTWQLTDNSGKPVVRERLWLTFKSGEIRLCKSCHGITSTSQTGEDEPENKPEAFRYLIQFMKTNGNAPLPTPSNPSSPTAVPTISATPSATGYFLKITRPKNKKRNQSKAALNLEVSRSGSLLADPLSVKFKINNFNCPQTGNIDFSGSSKVYKFSVPLSNKKQVISSTLIRNNITAASARVSVKETGKQKRKALQVCKAILKAF